MSELEFKALMGAPFVPKFCFAHFWNPLVGMPMSEYALYGDQLRKRKVTFCQNRMIQKVEKKCYTK